MIWLLITVPLAAGALFFVVIDFWRDERRRKQADVCEFANWEQN